ncbi:MAG: hypothetical protein K5891_01730 [Lachnospiraceae bacterium]|nr:hypothetical protein [Lachnospiraceae bacterium]
MWKIIRLILEMLLAAMVLFSVACGKQPAPLAPTGHAAESTQEAEGQVQEAPGDGADTALQSDVAGETPDEMAEEVPTPAQEPSPAPEPEPEVGPQITSLSKPFQILPNEDAMEAYALYLLTHSEKDLEAFRSAAPENALAYFLIDPPEEIAALLEEPKDVIMLQTYESHVYVIPLYDDMDVRLDYGSFDVDAWDFTTGYTLDECTLNAGENACYRLWVSEGIPEFCIYVSAGKWGGVFDVVMISGEYDAHGAFITASMTAEEARAGSTIRRPVAEDEVLYQDVLAWYKDAQDHPDTFELSDDAKYFSELVQRGWPWGATEDDVRYYFRDMDGNGIDELFFTHYSEIVDIYTLEAGKPKNIFGTMYRGWAELHADGVIMEAYAPSMTYSSTYWYVFDSQILDCCPYMVNTYSVNKDQQEDERFNLMLYGFNPEGVRAMYLDQGRDAVNFYQNSGELTEEEYNARCSHAPVVRVPEGKRLADYGTQK